MQQQYFHTVQELLSKNDLDGAKKEVLNHLKENPNDADGYNTLGMLFAKEQKYLKAKEYFLKAIENNVEEPTYHSNISNAYKKLGDLNKSKQHLNQALKLNPNYTEAYNNLGSLYYTEGRIEDAIPLFEKCLRMKPEYADAHYNLANCLVKKDFIQRACIHYQKVIQLNPRHMQARFNLAMTYIANHQLEEAIQSLNELLEFGENELALLQLGQIYLDLGKIEESKSCYSRVLNFVQSEEAHHNLAVLYLKMQQYEKAKEHFLKVLEINKENKTAKHMVNALLNNPEEAPPEFVSDLFNQYAERYNKHMKEELNYQAPHLLRRAISDCELVLTDERYILDLGCGTGLCGILFSDIKHKLIGVDLSMQMLLYAKTLKFYDMLCIYDINNAIPEFDYHVILAADVFCYIKDLNKVFALCKKYLVPKGLFAFTIELSDEDTELTKTGRFAHGVNYIHQLIEKHKFQKLKEQEVVLRTHNKSPVKGMLFVLSH